VISEEVHREGAKDAKFFKEWIETKRGGGEVAERDAEISG